MSHRQTGSIRPQLIPHTPMSAIAESSASLRFWVLGIWRENKERVTISQFVQIGSQLKTRPVTTREPLRHSTPVLWLQGITLAWMLVECGVALFAAVMAHSPAMLAFGSDSLVELMSATVVLLQFLPRFPISEERANRAAGVRLFALAIVVAVIAILALTLHLRPELDFIHQAA